MPTCIIASDNPSSIHEISFNRLTEEAVADSIICLLSILPSLQSLAIAADDDERQIDFGPILAALEWPALDEDQECAAGEKWPSAICPQLNGLRLRGWTVDSTLFRDVATSRVNNSPLHYFSRREMWSLGTLLL